ncbi:MAG: hypothetical protein AB1586_24505 [Pseudomonadota bacterium]
MKKILAVATAALLGATSIALAGSNKGGASGMSPGHEMRAGSTKGASEYSPGSHMRDKKGTVGRSKGASEYSPGDRMNDTRKSY